MLQAERECGAWCTARSVLETAQVLDKWNCAKLALLQRCNNGLAVMLHSLHNTMDSNAAAATSMSVTTMQNAVESGGNDRSDLDPNPMHWCVSASERGDVGCGHVL